MSDNSNLPPPTPPPPTGGTYTPPPQPPPQQAGGPPAGGGSSDRTLMLALSYIGILGVIPLLVRKDDRDIKWHAINGLLLFASFLVISVGWSILRIFVLDNIGCALGVIFGFIDCVIYLGYIAVMIMAIMKAVRGQRMRFPAISDFADKSV